MGPISLIEIRLNLGRSLEELNSIYPMGGIWPTDSPKSVHLRHFHDPVKSENREWRRKNEMLKGVFMRYQRFLKIFLGGTEFF